MNNIDKELPSINDLRALIAKKPINATEEKVELAYALLDRYLHGWDGSIRASYGDENDYIEMLSLLEEVSKDQAFLPRFIKCLRESSIEQAYLYLDKYYASAMEAGDKGLPGVDLFNEVVCLNASAYSFIPKDHLSRCKNIINKYWPNGKEYYSLVGLECIIQKDFDSALNFLSIAYQTDTTYSFTNHYLGVTYYSIRNWNSAIIYLKQAIIDPYFATILDSKYYLAQCYHKKKDHSLAIKYYEEILRDDKLYPDANNNIGWELYLIGKYSEAIDYFNFAIENKLDGTRPYHNKVRILKEKKEYKKAINVYIEMKKRFEAQKKSIDHQIEIIKNSIKEKPKSSDVIDTGTADEEVGHTSSESPAIHSNLRTVTDERKLRPSNGAFEIPAEKYLENFIEEKINREMKVFGKSLSIYNESNYYGRQLIIPEAGYGRIDILAKDNETNDFIVIELKKGSSGAAVVQQVARYMSWVRSNLAKDNENVYGFICVYSANETLINKVKSNPNLRLYEYALHEREK